LLSALLAGLVAIAVTVAIERLGGVVGGFLGTLPTTIVPASLGIAHQTETPAAFAAAMCAVPAGMLIDVLFLYLWRVVPPRLPAWSSRVRLVATAAIALAVWGASAAALVATLTRLQACGVPLAIVGALTLAAMLVVGVAACLRPRPAPRGSRRVGPATLLARGLLAAGAIAVSVWLVAVGGPLAAGVASVFPAIFLTTMVSLWLAQGEAVPSGAVGPMMLGSSAVAAYALVSAWSFPALGSGLGAAVAWVVAAAGITLPAALWMRRRV
jgi:hypothetical protein